MGRHSPVIAGLRHVWFTERLWKLAAGLPIFEIDPRTIPEVELDCWYCGQRQPTIRSIIEHMRRVEEASFAYPIIFNTNGSLMDGGHRIAKAILRDIPRFQAVRFIEMPIPDHTEAVAP